MLARSRRLLQLRVEPPERGRDTSNSRVNQRGVDAVLRSLRSTLGRWTMARPVDPEAQLGSATVTSCPRLSRCKSIHAPAPHRARDEGDAVAKSKRRLARVPWRGLAPTATARPPRSAKHDCGPRRQRPSSTYAVVVGIKSVDSGTVAFGLERKLPMATILEVLNASSGRNSATEDEFPKQVLTGRYGARSTNTLWVKDLRLYFRAA